MPQMTIYVMVVGLGYEFLGNEPQRCHEKNISL